MKNVPLKELIPLLEQELLRMGYKESTIKAYRYSWRKLIAYFEAHHESYYCEALAMQYVDEKCDFFAKEKAGLLTQSNSYLFRMIRMVGDFQQHGTIPRRYQATLSKINEFQHVKLLDQFIEACQQADYAKSTQKSYRRCAENFLSFLEANRFSVEDLTVIQLNQFVKTLMGYSYKMVEFVLCGLRAFLRFLHKQGILVKDLSDAIPCMQSRKQTRIPSVWNKEDLTKLLASIDRGNPSGKRDYALILLVARLGLRCVDVKRLTFSNFNWSENYLEFVQSKTKQPVRLPLLKDVGWAIIDYLKNGRPLSDSEFVFLRHLAPIAPFTEDDHLRQIIVKYMRRAKIPISPKKRVGMHSLRHTLATTLMEQHTPIQEIADILGHQSTESTPTYLKSSLELLKECALSPEVE